jgi:hypothetical protein
MKFYTKCFLFFLWLLEYFGIHYSVSNCLEIFPDIFPLLISNLTLSHKTFLWFVILSVLRLVLWSLVTVPCALRMCVLLALGGVLYQCQLGQLVASVVQFLCISLLIFCQLVLSLITRAVLQSVIIIMSLSIFSFQFYQGLLNIFWSSALWINHNSCFLGRIYNYL